MRLLTLTISIIVLNLTVLAGHVFGGYVTYKNLDSFSYEISYIIHRDCRGTSLSSTFNGFLLNEDGDQLSITAQRKSIRSITAVHSSLSDPCSPQNTNGTGNGVEEHTYVDTIDLRDSAFSSFLNSDELTVGFSLCCRTNSVGTSTNSYNFAKIYRNQSVSSSSPRLTGRWPEEQACNSPKYFNLGAIDPLDDDSLSFQLVSPLSAAGTPIPYTGSFTSATQPFSVYFPGGGSTGTPNPNTTPPSGFYLDPETGDMIYTPTKCDEVTLACLEITEWRMDSSGIYQKLGLIRYDMQFMVSTFPGNTTPQINGPYAYEVCEGDEICFITETDDQAFTPPPPDTTVLNDTVVLLSNQAIPESYFSIVDSTEKQQRGKFCWSPLEGSARSRPYIFHLTARDNAGPRNALSSRAISIKVKQRAKATGSVIDVGCGSFALSSNLDSNFNGSASHHWRLYDSVMQAVFDPNIASFKSSGIFRSMTQTDTLYIKRNGIYLLEYTVNNSPSNCPSVYYDTLTVTGMVESFIDGAPETICVGAEFQLDAYSKFGPYPAQYGWLINGDSLMGHTDSSLTSKILEYDTTYSYTFWTAAANGCVVDHTVNITSHPYQSSGIEDSTTCPLPLNISTLNDISSVLWSTGDTGRTVVLSDSGDYSLQYKDSFNCTLSDSFTIAYFPTTPLELSDTDVCDDPVNLSITEYDSILWSNGSTMNNLTVFSSATISVLVIDSNGCSFTDTANIQIHSSPDVYLTGDQDFCCNDADIPWTDFLSVHDSSGGQWVTQLKANSSDASLFSPSESCTIGQASLRYDLRDQQTGCVGSDSIFIWINPLPAVSLMNGSYCQNQEEIDLQDHVNLPSNPLIGSQSWSCLQCNGNDLDDILENRGGMAADNYWLLVDTNMYTIQGNDSDQLILLYCYQSSQGCETCDTLHLTIYRSPQAPVIQQHGSFLISQSGELWWFRNDTSLGILSDSLELGINGSYKGQRINDYGCESVSSNTAVVNLSIAEVAEGVVEVWPNPNTGILFLRYPSSLEIKEIHLLNQLGQEMDLGQQSLSRGRLQLNLSHAGSYLLEVETSKGLLRKKILVLP